MYLLLVHCCRLVCRARLATHHLAWNILRRVSERAPPIAEVWASEIGRGPRQWLAEILPGTTLFQDMSKRRLAKKDGKYVMTGTTVGGTFACIESASIDMYVAGFPCNPWSARGARNGFHSESGSLLFECLKTVRAIAPKAFILENVPSILSGESGDFLRTALNTLKDYQWKAVHVNSLQFGLPQNRKRVYVIGLRRGAVFGDESSAISDIIADVRAVRARSPSWPDYFKDRGLGTWGTSETVPAQVCATCCLTQACLAHACGCLRCRRKGVGAAKCVWRRSTKKFRVKHKKARDSFLKMLRRVKKKPDLKIVPTYWSLAESRGLRVPVRVAKSPRIRHLLDAHASCCNVMSGDVLLDISQSVERVALRTDGTTPTLTTTCGSLFSPSRGVCLSPAQCFALQGLRLDDYVTASDFADADLYSMAGMAFSSNSDLAACTPGFRTHRPTEQSLTFVWSYGLAKPDEHAGDELASGWEHHVVHRGEAACRMIQL